ncbi:TetR/AcrR family transcriptional regulator [Uliginosibacterium sp. 31-16]|uniref:TetR/AcrR family transcriptional regulator n=1 Tax=Uliginosibacterium sp. 31-16 TaxID=3068315 RepID=UPI00273FF9A6|nr:TetR/AcrR family transcriptional regulator [Uliginosibacterium sp. 31-16]MDP5239846.1 TetR/AcrR family transcriptional regulator [Uliginosibacterium sp. 31-16]
MARRNDHSREEIRSMALDAAEKIVAEEGFKGLSARKLAAAINYTVGTLYLVFANLDDIVQQVNERTLDALYDWLRAHAKDAVTPEEALLALANAYIAYAETRSARWNMLFEYVADNGSTLPPGYLVKAEKVFGLVEASLTPLAGQNSISEVQQAARVLWAGVHGICLLKIRQRMDLAGEQNAEAMAHMLVENFLRGFRHGTQA